MKLTPSQARTLLRLLAESGRTNPRALTTDQRALVGALRNHASAEDPPPVATGPAALVGPTSPFDSLPAVVLIRTDYGTPALPVVWIHETARDAADHAAEMRGCWDPAALFVVDAAVRRRGPK
jgi:hypothetical protein